MHFFFSSSGNSMIDLDYESMCELQPLAWEPDEVAFAKEIMSEAETIMADVLAGLALLNDQSEMLQALQDNVRQIYQAIQKHGGKCHATHIQLAWPQFTGGTN